MARKTTKPAPQAKPERVQPQNTKRAEKGDEAAADLATQADQAATIVAVAGAVTALETAVDLGQEGAVETGEDPAAAPAWIADPDTGLDPRATLIVTGPKRGRWRAGRHFGPEPVEISCEDLTPDEFIAIVNEEKLTISVIYSET